MTRGNQIQKKKHEKSDFLGIEVQHYLFCVERRGLVGFVITWKEGKVESLVVLVCDFGRELTFEKSPRNNKGGVGPGWDKMA